MRHAKGAFKSHTGTVTHQVEVSPRAARGHVAIEIMRTDAKGTHHVMLGLDEARALLRDLQSACDQAQRLAYVAHKDAEERAKLDQVLERVAKAEGAP